MQLNRVIEKFAKYYPGLVSKAGNNGILNNVQKIPKPISFKIIFTKNRNALTRTNIEQQYENNYKNL